MRALLQRLGDRNAGAMLDAGCGSGEVARRVVEAVAGVARLVMIDIDAATLDEARDQFIGVAARIALEFHTADVRRLPFADRSFDTVLLCDVLHHSGDPSRAVAECVRVLKPEGLLLFSEMVCDGLFAAESVGRDLHHFKSAIDRLNGVPHDNTLPRSAIEETLAAAPLETVWWQLERFAPADPADAAGRERIDARREFVDSYLQHAERLPHYAALRREAAFLNYRLERAGFAEAPELRLLARKCGARLS
ncbi:MAG: class I SAM-dependent methyltransferase [Spirochaetaceae bacterium]|nr:MAG: class I SAM-dependent methyltransferase [Spirochaetaceae bacterium]